MAVCASHYSLDCRGLFANMQPLAGNAFQDQTEALLAALLEVAQKSTEVDADSSRFPDGWLFSHRCASLLHIVAPALRQMPGASAMHGQVVNQTADIPAA